MILEKWVDEFETRTESLKGILKIEILGIGFSTLLEAKSACYDVSFSFNLGG